MASEEYPQGWIQTRYGRFDPEHPVFDRHDIAHALGMIVRYNGHVKEFYSVAEHSVLVATLMAKVTGGDPYEGLMHDSTEAYLSDVPKPLKKLLPELKAWDARMEGAMRAQYGLSSTITKECKHADWLALGIEAHYLMPDGGAGYYYPPGIREEIDALVDEGWKPEKWSPEEASLNWQMTFDALTAKRSAAL